MPSPTTPVLDALQTASQRLVRTVDALSDDEWHSPSLLPGWTRAHVVAHLTLNAEGLAGAVTGALEAKPVTMYASERRRDGDIAVLGRDEPPRISQRLHAAVSAFHHALTALAAAPEAVADAKIRRTPEGERWFSLRHVGLMRWREVEIHHVDLGCDYRPSEWPLAFTSALLDDTVRRHHDALHATLWATDLGAYLAPGRRRGERQGPGRRPRLVADRPTALPRHRSDQ